MTRQLARSLWLTAALALCGAVALSWASTRSALVDAWAIPGVGPEAPVRRTDLGDLAHRITESDPFRLDRRPSPLPFGSAPAELVAEVPPAARPPSVTGIVGPPWRAALEGIPGRDGAVLVKAGDTLNGWRVREVRRDSIVIVMQETTWRLAVRTP